MKINYILPSIFQSGGVTTIYEYCTHLTKSGYEVCLYYPVLPYDNHKNISSCIGIINYCKSFRYHLKNLLFNKFPEHNFKIKVVPFLNDFFLEPADFVVATTWHTAYLVNNLDKVKGKKIYFIQGYESWDANIELVDNSYLLGLNCITISQNLKNLLYEKFKVNAELIYNGFSKENFYCENKRKNFKLRNFLFIDYGAKLKNTKLLIKGLQKIKTKYPQINISSFGFQNFSPLPDYVKFYLNPDTDLKRKLYNEADLFIFPSLAEGFGNPPVEAMACKCAVASTAAGGVLEYLKDNETGFILKNDLSNLMSIIDNLIKDENILETISQNGYESVKIFMGWEKPVQKFLNYINSI